MSGCWKCIRRDWKANRLRILPGKNGILQTWIYDNARTAGERLGDVGVGCRHLAETARKHKGQEIVAVSRRPIMIVQTKHRGSGWRFRRNPGTHYVGTAEGIQLIFDEFGEVGSDKGLASDTGNQYIRLYHLTERTKVRIINYGSGHCQFPP